MATQVPWGATTILVVAVVIGIGFFFKAIQMADNYQGKHWQSLSFSMLTLGALLIVTAYMHFLSCFR